MEACFELLQREGLALGTSSGINVAGAERLAQELGPGNVLVTILCDSASRYQGKMFNREFLRSKGLPEPTWVDPELLGLGSRRGGWVGSGPGRRSDQLVMLMLVRLPVHNGPVTPCTMVLVMLPELQLHTLEFLPQEVPSM